MRVLHPVLAAAVVLLSGCGGGAGDTTPAGGGGMPPGGVGGGGGGGSAGSPIPIYILVGGHKPSGANPVNPVPPGSDVFLDGLNIADDRLRPGEVYVMAKSRLAANAHFTVTVAATTIGSESFSGSIRFSTGSSSNPVALTTTSALDELNALRAQSRAAPVSFNAPYKVAAQRHAGYQCETGAITHNEPGTSARFFVNNDFFRRICLALGKPASAPETDPDAYGVGVTTVYEDIATTAGIAAIDQLWNTVYHRIPMMRSEVASIGNGDRSDAFADARNRPQVIAATGTGFQTIEFAGYGAMQTLSFWPPDGATGVATAFSTDSESPDPVSSANGNGTGDADVVGPPLTVLFPTSHDFATISVTLTQN